MHAARPVAAFLLCLLVCLVVGPGAASAEPPESQVRLTEPVTFAGNVGRLADVRFSPDGSALAGGSYFSYRGGAEVIQGRLALWDVASKKRTVVSFSELPADFRPRVRDYPYLNFRCVAFSPDGRTLATGIGAYKARKNGKNFVGALILWDVATGKRKVVLTGHTDQVTSVRYSPDGRLLASGSDDGTVRLWDMATGKQTAVLKGHTRGVQCVTFRCDGAKLASAGGHGKAVRIWNVATGESAVLQHDDFVAAVAFSPDGRQVATSSRGQGRSGDYVRLWDAETGELNSKLEGHTGRIRGIAFSPDGQLLATAGGEPLNSPRREQGGRGELILWDVAAGKQLASQETRNQFTCVDISRDGQSLVAGNLDGTIRLWHLAPPADDGSRKRTTDPRGAGE